MKKKSKNPVQHEQVLFPFGDGSQIPDIRYDQVFKAVFTRDTAKSRGALSDLISALIGRTVAVETVAANEPPIDDMRQRRVRFDVSCRTEEGELVNVEMSFNPSKDELVRLEYYTAVLFTGQDIYGKNKDYNVLKEAYQIAIIAKEKFFPDEYLIHTFLYYDPKTHVSLDGKTRIITVELEKTKPLVEKPVEEMTNAELWAVFFQYLTDEEKRSKIIDIINREEGIAMTVSALGSITKNEAEFFRNLSLLKGELDYQDHMTHANKKGLEEGRKVGLEEGRKEGRKETNLENARKMKTMGFLTEQIQAVTGLSAENIDQL
jgi:predicted transposase/invertase (TIGR01784 family)